MKKLVNWIFPFVAFVATLAVILVLLETQPRLSPVRKLVEAINQRLYGEVQTTQFIEASAYDPPTLEIGTIAGVPEGGWHLGDGKALVKIASYPEPVEISFKNMVALDPLKAILHAPDNVYVDASVIQHAVVTKSLGESREIREDAKRAKMRVLALETDLNTLSESVETEVKKMQAIRRAMVGRRYPERDYYSPIRRQTTSPETYDEGEGV